jgi:exodeoxyribonuclease VII small subunit
MDAAPTGSSEERSYDQLVAGLEGCVRELEEGKLPLEQAIERFKEGVALVKLAEQRLQAAEGQVNLLLRGEDGQDRKEAFASPAANETPRGPRLATSSAPAAPAAKPAGPAADDDIPF